MATTHTWLLKPGYRLEIVKQLLASSSNIVIASCRKPDEATELKELEIKSPGRLHLVTLDILDGASIKASMEGENTAFEVDEDSFSRTLKSNVVGPALTAQAYLPYLEKGTKKTIVNISSALGSLAVIFDSRYAAYSASKAALNMLTQKQAKARKDIISISLDPGWVQTDMGGPNADIKPQVSVGGLLKVITTATPEKSGKYIRYTGEELAW
ncbi:NAD-P-binding protein [Multifurca ochricompacta]|uniref:NAD-P-binding protein n=1 Tax=Multifurca ochricompacta TaxID=376703 RepID=A0AAD4M1I8_9AGAM|nr:NAD-P-binding protein [Multifurca ochricompacta]